MALTANHIITNRVRILLADVDAVQWTDAQLLEWYNEGLTTLVQFLPESYSVTAYHELVYGVQQHIPTDGFMLLEVICNAYDENSPGRAVRRVDRNELDVEFPNWAASTPKLSVRRYIPSLTDPRSFMVYPPSLGDVGVLMVYAKQPPQALTMGDEFPFSEIYAAAIVDYTMFRAWASFQENADADRQADKYEQRFYKSVGATGSNQEARNAVARDPI